MVTPELIARSAGVSISPNIISVYSGLKVRMVEAGLQRPHRLAHYLPQIGHESASFKYDREIWGPTPAQARYDIRKDLGNTPERDGDGKLYMGRTAMQLTGKANYQRFTDWVWVNVKNVPPVDFVKNPDAVNTDPWEGLVPIWFWEITKLNNYADQNNIEMITRRINGGLNGLEDRVRRYPRAALVLLGKDPRDIKGFQAANGLIPDGIAGPTTRTSLHRALLQLPDLKVA